MHVHRQVDDSWYFNQFNFICIDLNKRSQHLNGPYSLNSTPQSVLGYLMQVRKNLLTGKMWRKPQTDPQRRDPSARTDRPAIDVTCTHNWQHRIYTITFYTTHTKNGDPWDPLPLFWAVLTLPFAYKVRKELLPTARLTSSVWVIQEQNKIFSLWS